MAAPQLLWDALRAQLAAAEVEEVRSILGSAAIDRNAQLARELQALTEILSVAREENAALAAKMEAHAALPAAAEAEAVARSICVFVDSLRAASAASAVPESGATGADAVDAALDTPRARQVVRMIVSDGIEAAGGTALRRGSRSSRRRPRSRPGSALPRSTGAASSPRLSRRPPSSSRRRSRPLSARAASRPASAGSSSSGGSVWSAPDVLAPVSHALSVERIEEVTETLRAALSEEAERLLEEVEWAQHCLEEEADLRCAAEETPHGAVAGGGDGEQAPPTIKELRECEAKLEEQFRRVSIASMMPSLSPSKMAALPSTIASPGRRGGRGVPPLRLHDAPSKLVWTEEGGKGDDGMADDGAYGSDDDADDGGRFDVRSRRESGKAAKERAPSSRVLSLRERVRRNREEEKWFM
eukprot:PLAT8817.1.p1 GENE.PLAT8817.1~~PLAT8817.1.p1  ORF type:complete len:415 (+),score=159.08 PLAT8817.1:51-1295(+)